MVMISRSMDFRLTIAGGVVVAFSASSSSSFAIVVVVIGNMGIRITDARKYAMSFAETPPHDWMRNAYSSLTNRSSHSRMLRWWYMRS